jgi:hypothetical protein
VAPEYTAFVCFKTPKDVYVEILFTFTNDFHCVLKLSLYKTWVTRNLCCEHEEVYSLYSFWHHNNKKKLAYKTRQSKSLLCGRCRRRVARKWRGDRNLFYSPYNLLHQICLLQTHFLSSIALLRIHLLFSLRLLIFAFETIFSGSSQRELLLSIFLLPIFFSFLQLQGNVCWILQSHSYIEEMPKISLQKDDFGPVFFSMQPILETELTVKKKTKTCKQDATQDPSFWMPNTWNFMQDSHLPSHIQQAIKLYFYFLFHTTRIAFDLAL